MMNYPKDGSNYENHPNYGGQNLSYAESAKQQMAQNQLGAAQGYANTQQPRLKQQINELAEVLARIDHQTTAIHGRVVPPTPQATGEAGRSAPQTYEQMIEMLISLSSMVRNRLDEISERV